MNIVPSDQSANDAQTGGDGWATLAELLRPAVYGERREPLIRLLLLIGAVAVAALLVFLILM